MRLSPYILLMALLAGCGRNPETVKTEQFFKEWLKGHGETNIVVDSAGVGIAGNQTRLRASLYGAEKAGNGYTAEVEFDISLPSGGPIIEYVAGSGDTRDKAMDQALANYILTTAHVVYRAFMNPADVHQRVKSVTINGKTREMFAGDMVQFGVQAGGPIDLDSMSAQIQDLATALPLGTGPHWVKIVYSQRHSKPMTVAATLDNNDAAGLTSSVRNLKWPDREQFYMVKQFIVIK